MNSNDRCDVCSAQAYLRVMFKTGDLLFCAHHYDRLSPSFPDNFVMEDQRDKLLAKNDAA